jgi:succinyl-CoA synthetase beta subunit
MKIHEFQAKEILRRYNVPVPAGIVATSTADAVDAAQQLADQGAKLFVVKAQIHAGGRGKGGGVKLARSVDEVAAIADKMIGMNLVTHQTGPEGQPVKKVLITDGVDIESEMYVGITLDRAKNMPVIMVSTEGGVEIEEVAAKTPEKIHKVWVDPAVGLQPFQTRTLAYALELKGSHLKQAIKFIAAAYKAYASVDASLLEINPLVITSSGELTALDAKINLDDNGLFRHPDIAAYRDLDEEDPFEVEATKHDLNYVKLDGNVGCMVNGAGLAMATMDIIKLWGGEPANFLDVGGGASAETVEAGFRIILKDPNVEAILVNIFGGIVRCDRVARGIVEAAHHVDINVPLVVRLQGTNADEGLAILDESDVELQTAASLDEAAEKVVGSL